MAPPFAVLKAHAHDMPLGWGGLTAHILSSCLLTSVTSSRSVKSCLTMEPYVSVNISAFCSRKIIHSANVFGVVRELKIHALLAVVLAGRRGMMPTMLSMGAQMLVQSTDTLRI